MGSLEEMIAKGLFVGLRVGTLMIFAPFLGSMAIPARIKAGLTFAITGLLYPVYAPHSIALGAIDWWRVICGEMVAGLAIGLTIQFVFDGVELAGQLLGFQLGYSLVNLIDPQTQVDTPVLAIFHQAFVLLVFLQLNVHHWMLRGLAKSFEYLPPGAASATPAATKVLMHAAGGMLLVGIQIAAPALAATVLVDVALGFLGKASPQLPILFVGISVKNLVGFAVLAGALGFWPRMFDRYFLNALQTTERLLHLVR